MKQEIISEVVNLNISRDDLIYALSNWNLILSSLSKELKDISQIKGDKLILKDVVKITIEIAEVTDKHILFNIDLIGFKTLNLWIQVVPTEEDVSCKVRAVLHIEVSKTGQLLGLEKELNPDKIKESMDYYLIETKNSLEEEIKKKG